MMRRIAAVMTLRLLEALLWMALMAVPTMVLWNAVVPALFHLPPMTYAQAVALLILAALLIQSTFRIRG
jgi:hypothetical protein